MNRIEKSISQPLLLIEDSADDYEATTRAFAKANLYNPVIWCKSGEEALELLHGKKIEWPGLIMLDLNMPGLDGRKVLALLKEDEKLRQIPVIILTTSADTRDIEECYRMGANSYVQKPVSFDGLIEAIRRLKEYWFEMALLPKGAG